jgi:uncharacterized protein YcbX
MTVARVVGIFRYPVKSMAPEPLTEVAVDWAGLSGDRRWAFIRSGQERNGFPWLTIRQLNTMGRYRPEYLDPDRLDAADTVVHTPTGEKYDVTDPALAAELGAGVRVIRHGVGVFDTAPLSLVSTRTLADLGDLAGRDLDVRRFRPNLLVAPVVDTPYPEDSWVGRGLRVGALRMRVDQRDQRCVMINVDPVTAERDPVVLQTVAQHRDVCVGVYGATVTPATVRLGDEVVLED